MGQIPYPRPYSWAVPSIDHFESPSNQDPVDPHDDNSTPIGQINIDSVMNTPTRTDPLRSPKMVFDSTPPSPTQGSTSKVQSDSNGEPPNSAIPEIADKGLALRNQGFHPSIAFAFDIDGVLIRSKEPLPSARDTLLMLQQFKVPFIFLTNGGGLTEVDHAALMGRRLGLEFSEEQFVQSHTPFRATVPRFRDATVLILGGVGSKNCEVAEVYGFKNVLSSSDIFRAEPDIYPFAELTSAQHIALGKDPGSIPRTAGGRIKIDAIFVFSSPRDWGLDIQLIIDLLLSQDGILGTVSHKNGDLSLPNNGYQQDGQPGIHFCNSDVMWAAKYSQPRVAQGAFAAALEGVWHARTNSAKLLNRFYCGKPTSTTYQYADYALLKHNATQCTAILPPGAMAPKIKTVYMIGDNPASDIQGANEFESLNDLQWRSILVETGVYEAGTVPAHVPTAIVKDVKEAVRLAFQVERGAFELQVWLSLLGE